MEALLHPRPQMRVQPELRDRESWNDCCSRQRQSQALIKVLRQILVSTNHHDTEESPACT